MASSPAWPQVMWLHSRMEGPLVSLVQPSSPGGVCTPSLPSSAVRGAGWALHQQRTAFPARVRVQGTLSMCHRPGPRSFHILRPRESAVFISQKHSNTGSNTGIFTVLLQPQEVGHLFFAGGGTEVPKVSVVCSRLGDISQPPGWNSRVPSPSQPLS